MNEEKIHLCDYAVAFIDLLGQKAEMPERYLPDDNEEAIALIKKSVGRIVTAQRQLQDFYDVFSRTDGIYSRLPAKFQAELPDWAPGELKWQHFSDGLVIYVPLGSGAVKSPVNSIFGLLGAAGLMCMSGLAMKAPLRIGIDVAWAVEYRPNELYGAALAYSYQLESEVAKWPRVVIGEGLTDYLQHYVVSGATGPSAQIRSDMAALCLGMIEPGTDRQGMLHYLGSAFSEATENVLQDKRLIDDAQSYVSSQLEHWESRNCQKLATRYRELASYFERSARKG